MVILDYTGLSSNFRRYEWPQPTISVQTQTTVAVTVAISAMVNMEDGFGFDGRPCADQLTSAASQRVDRDSKPHAQSVDPSVPGGVVRAAHEGRCRTRSRLRVRHLPGRRERVPATDVRRDPARPGSRPAFAQTAFDLRVLARSLAAGRRRARPAARRSAPHRDWTTPQTPPRSSNPKSPLLPSCAPRCRLDIPHTGEHQPGVNRAGSDGWVSPGTARGTRTRNEFRQRHSASGLRPLRL